MSFSLLNTRRFKVPSAFTRYCTSKSPTMAVSVIPPTGTPTFPLTVIRSLIREETITPNLPSNCWPGVRSAATYGGAIEILSFSFEKISLKRLLAFSNKRLLGCDWLTPSGLKKVLDESNDKACVWRASLSSNLYCTSDFNELLTLGKLILKSGSGLVRLPLTPIITSTSTFLLNDGLSISTAGFAVVV